MELTADYQSIQFMIVYSEKKNDFGEAPQQNKQQEQPIKQQVKVSYGQLIVMNTIEQK